MTSKPDAKYCDDSQENDTGLDLEAIENDWRAGLSSRRIGDIHGISHSRAQRLAKRYGWSRDLTAKVHRKARDLMWRTAAGMETGKTPGSRPEESSASPGESGQGGQSGTLGTLEQVERSEDEIVASAAEVQVAVVRSHQDTLRRLNNVVRAMLGQLEAYLGIDARGMSPEEFDAVQEAARISIMGKNKGPADIMLACSGAMSKLIPLERRAFQIDDTGEAGDSDPMAIEARVKAAAERDQAAKKADTEARKRVAGMAGQKVSDLAKLRRKTQDVVDDAA